VPGDLPPREQPAHEAGLCDWDSTPLIQREDDKESAVAQRLAEYDKRTAPLIDYYNGRSHFHRIDGNRAATWSSRR
jgi:adenylate kinase